MQKILTKRVFRDLKANIFRYLALMVMIAICMFIVVALIGSAESVMNGTDKYHDDTFVEDGQFTTFIPLSKEDVLGFEKLGVVTEQHFGMDYNMEDNSVVRVMKVREKIDLLHVIDGRIPTEKNEIAIDPRYKTEHNLSLGDTLKLGDESFEIVGIVTTADYDSPMKEFGDTAADSFSFCISFVSEQAYENLLNKGQNARAEVYLYAYRIIDNTITDNVVISSAAASKFGLKKGDELIVTDDEEDKNYCFNITDVADYSTSMYAFMDIESMRELFDKEDDYFNVVFSDDELDIPTGRLYAITTKQAIERASDVFINNMRGMVIMITACASVVFIIVLYLMMKVMIDRSAFNISLIKIFGYRKNEIRKLYLDGNFYFVALGALICIPLSKLIMDSVFPYMVSNVGCQIDLSFPIWEYALIYVIILILYLIINRVLIININKILPAEVLKNRE